MAVRARGNDRSLDHFRLVRLVNLCPASMLYERRYGLSLPLLTRFNGAPRKSYADITMTSLLRVFGEEAGPLVKYRDFISSRMYVCIDT